MYGTCLRPATHACRPVILCIAKGYMYKSVHTFLRHPQHGALHLNPEAYLLNMQWQHLFCFACSRSDGPVWQLIAVPGASWFTAA
jgi:hypothetical protein